MTTTAVPAKQPWNYLLLVFVLAVPFWMLGSGRLPLPFSLPVSALVTFVPLLAAVLLVYWQRGFTGVKVLLKKAWARPETSDRFWYAPALLLPLLLYFLSYVVMRWLGRPLPVSDIPLYLVLLFFPLFMLMGAGEEIGWSGYAIDPLQERWGKWQAGLILGIIWALWHLIPFLQTQHQTSWVVWQSSKTIAMRMVLVWLYNRTNRSILAANLYHASDNTSWALFPNYGSHYDPLVTSLLNWLMLAIIFGYEWRFRTNLHD